MHDNPAGFLDVKIRSLVARARRLSRLTPRGVGIRSQDLPYAPSAAHFSAANARLAAIDRDVSRQLSPLLVEVELPGRTSPQQLLDHSAAVEREVDRARRAFALFFDLFSQRGTLFAPALAACDEIATDCYRVVRTGAPYLFREPLLKPLTYLEHSVSPATYRRGVMLQRLLGETNPFPLVRVPHEHIESPWGMGVLLHEVSHNLQSDLGVWEENAEALGRRVLSLTGSSTLTRVWMRWHKEIFADMLALLLGGPASSRSMQEFLSYPASRMLTFQPLAVHPTPFVRGFLLAEMLRRMGFSAEAHATAATWRGLYARHSPNRMPRALLATAPALIPHVVDEVAFQPRRGLAQKALADLVMFSRHDEAWIRNAAHSIARGQLPRDLPARLAVSASRHAFEHRLGSPITIARTVLHGLARRGMERRNQEPLTPELVAA
jgi:hypothetical protein